MTNKRAGASDRNGLSITPGNGVRITVSAIDATSNVSARSVVVSLAELAALPMWHHDLRVRLERSGEVIMEGTCSTEEFSAFMAHVDSPYVESDDYANSRLARLIDCLAVEKIAREATIRALESLLVMPYLNVNHLARLVGRSQQTLNKMRRALRQKT